MRHKYFHSEIELGGEDAVGHLEQCLTDTLPCPSSAIFSFFNALL